MLVRLVLPGRQESDNLRPGCGKLPLLPFPPVATTGRPCNGDGMMTRHCTDFWVFGYGSLMWNPGFTFEEAVPAVLDGYYRSFCIYSHHYRGTPARPGLVLGLNEGGQCSGLGFRIAPDQVGTVQDYLRERELIGYAYREATLPLALRDGRTCDAYTFVADPTHGQYAGELGLERSAELIMDAVGCAGLNRDYLIQTVRRLEAHGFHDPHLFALLREVEVRTGAIEAGSGI